MNQVSDAACFAVNSARDGAFCPDVVAIPYFNAVSAAARWRTEEAPPMFTSQTALLVIAAIDRATNDVGRQVA
jgi:hypothetical protein